MWGVLETSGCTRRNSHCDLEVRKLSLIPRKIQWVFLRSWTAVTPGNQRQRPMHCCSSLTATLAKRKYPFPQEQWRSCLSVRHKRQTLLPLRAWRDQKNNQKNNQKKKNQKNNQKNNTWAPVFPWRNRNACGATCGTPEAARTFLVYGGNMFVQSRPPFGCFQSLHFHFLVYFQKAGVGSCTYRKPLLELNPWSHCAVWIPSEPAGRLCTKHSNLSCGDKFFW